MSRLLSDRQERELVLRLCDCSKCEFKDTCLERDNYRRLPEELFKGGIGSCPKIRNMRF